jgi:hypothetical protein
MGKRKELITVKLVDFTKDKDEPAYDIELFVNGKFIFDKSAIFSTETEDKKIAYNKAVDFAIEQLSKTKRI